jgi:hypothetical protein
MSKAFDRHLAAARTSRRLTLHDTPQLNRIAERLNRTLLERIRAFTHSTGLPKSLWGEALRHATWLKNCTATRSFDGKTPYEALLGTPPDLAGVRAFGCPVWVHDPTGSKLDARTHECRWLGFDVESKAHRIYWPSSSKVSVERNIYFGTSAQLEGEGIHLPDAREQPATPPDNPTTPSTPPRAPTPPAPDAPPESSPIESEPDPVDEEAPSAPPGRPARDRKPSRRMRDLLSGEGVTSVTEAGGVDPTLENAEDAAGIELVFAAETSEAEALEPRTLAEAKRRPDWHLWAVLYRPHQENPEKT